MRAKRLWVAGCALAALSGCGGDASVAICFGTTAFCSQPFGPVADAGPDQTVVSGSLVTLDGSASEGSISSYAWTQTGGPAVTLVNANTAVATFNAPFVASAVTLTFQLTVVDQSNQADTDTTSVTVQP
jgi:chitinase